MPSLASRSCGAPHRGSPCSPEELRGAGSLHQGCCQKLPGLQSVGSGLQEPGPEHPGSPTLSLQPHGLRQLSVTPTLHFQSGAWKRSGLQRKGAAGKTRAKLLRTFPALVSSPLHRSTARRGALPAPPSSALPLHWHSPLEVGGQRPRPPRTQPSAPVFSSHLLSCTLGHPRLCPACLGHASPGSRGASGAQLLLPDPGVPPGHGFSSRDPPLILGHPLH